MRSIRSWFTPETRSSDPQLDYTGQLLAAQLLAAQGIDGIKSTAAYRGGLTLIGHAVGVATLTGQHSGSLQPHLSTIARELVDVGQSDWLISVGSTGEVELLPVTTVAVVGGPDPRSWLYSLTLAGPTETVTVQRSGESILSFRLRVQSKSPWRGRPAISSSGTAQLLCQLESQLRDEAKVTPARVISGGAAADQAKDISEIIGAGGVVGITQAFATASTTDPSGIRAGVVRNETSAPSVALHEKLSIAILGALGIPADLVLGSSSESGSRESFRRMASTTIQNILTTISREWQTKLGTALEYSLDNLKSADDVSRARALGSRANAVQRLVQSGVELPQALAIAGVD